MFRLGGSSKEPTLRLESGPALYVFRPSEPSTRPRAALLWMHGGGLVMGHPLQGVTGVRPLVDDLDLVLVAVQYRLAPEHPFPAALDDCEAALRWLAEQPDVDAERLVVGGVSAGGGLAAALCQRLWGTDLTLAGQVLVYPMLDDRSVAPPQVESLFRLWDRRSNDFGWSSYLGAHTDPPPPFAVPARCTDLRGLPPAWIGVGTLDLFHAEDTAYAQRLRDAGVHVHLEVVPGAYHGFDVVDAQTPVARAFHDSMVTSLTRMITPPGEGDSQPAPA